MAKPVRQGELGGLALLAGGFILVSMSIGGYVIGAIVDKQLGTAPKGAIIGLIIGTLIGFWDLYRIAVRIMKQQPSPSPEQQKSAKENWEKSEEEIIKSEGVRDENHE